MEVVSDSARVRPVSERTNPDIRVADKMRSMRFQDLTLHTNLFWQYGVFDPRLARSQHNSECR